MKVLVSLGSSGIVGFIMWLLLRKNLQESTEDRQALRAAQAAIVSALNTRVDALESHVRECENDRTKLWQKLLDRNQEVMALSAEAQHTPGPK